MAAMRGDCPADCLAQLQATTMWFQIRGVSAGAVLLLVTNVGVIAWVALLKGGRLDAARPVRAVSRSRLWIRRSGWPTAGQWLLAAGLGGSALIHLMVVPQHLAEWPAAGAFFMALAVVQVAGAAAILSRLCAPVLLGTALVSVGPLLVWTLSRAWGLPIGPETGVPEPIGTPDAAACLLELWTLALAGYLLARRHAAAGRPDMRGHIPSVAAMAVLAVTLIGVAAIQDGGSDPRQHAASTASGILTQ